MIRRLISLILISLLVSLFFEHEKEPYSILNHKEGEKIKAVIVINQSIYSSKSDQVGFNYRLLEKYSERTGVELEIIQPLPKVDYWELLSQGEIDIIVADSQKDTIPAQYTELAAPSFYFKDSTAWYVNSNNGRLLYNVNFFLSWLLQEREFAELSDLFYKSYPTKRRISPYDEIVKKESIALCWDWKLLSALIYQESRFSICAYSDKGAIGLMQIRKSTAENYKVADVYNPESNIQAGVKHLKYLKNLFLAKGVDSLNITKFTLAAYNAGEGRIQECMEFANRLGRDGSSWDTIKQTIPIMRDSTTLSTPFRGVETLRYVDAVLAKYEEYRELLFLPTP